MNPRSRPPTVTSAAQVPPLLADVTRWPLAYGLVFGFGGEAQLQTYAYVPAEGFETARNTMAYRVPAVSVGGTAKFAEKNPPEGLLKPAIVAVARSTPVGTGVAPVVARIETVMFGVVPVQPEQKRLRSTCVSWPATPAVKVCPAHAVLLNPKPAFVVVVFC